MLGRKSKNKNMYNVCFSIISSRDNPFTKERAGDQTDISFRADGHELF